VKIIGVVPARMASSRFPGKPLFPICGRPMLEHAYRRAAKYPKWTGLYLATCDGEIADFGRSLGFPVIMTSDKHTRALERVAEAAGSCGEALAPDDVVVCVQADEPMLHPDMIAASMQPLFDDAKVPCTVLAMQIEDEEVYLDSNSLKIIHDLKGDVLYTSRSPVPHCEKFHPGLGARRIYGIFAFRWHFLQTFIQLAPSPLELVESCDSNRIMDHGYRQRIAPYPCRPSFSVDAPTDAERVEAHMRKDPLWGTY
jgi:3-deoxy-manno-octulosonate cytidylyltransferase (CMP-KDO synthetase)